MPAQLVAALAQQGVRAAIVQSETGAPDLIRVATASTASLTSVAAFWRGAVTGGLVVDLTGATPRLSDGDDVARGSVLILWHDGRRELREGLSDQQLGYVIRSALATLNV